MSKTMRPWTQRIALGLAITLAAAPWIAAAVPSTYTLDVFIDGDAGSFHGEESVVYTNDIADPLDEIFFRLYANGSALYGSARIEVTEAWADSTPVEPRRFVEDTVLMLPLPTPLLPGQTASLRLLFEGTAASSFDPEETAYGLLTRSERTLTLTAFYPLVAPYLEEGWSLDPIFAIGDALFADAADYDVTLHVKPGWVPVAPGRRDGPVEPGSAGTYRYTLSDARDFSAALWSDERPEETREIHGVSVFTHFAPNDQTAAETALADALTSISVFSHVLGALPFEEVHLVEVPLRGVAGVEFTGLILIDEGYASSPSDPFFHVIVTHEIAHQWFYAVVGNDPVEAPWMDEGLATYLSNVALEVVASPEMAESERRSWARVYDWARKNYPSLGPTSPVYAYPDSAVYSSYVYSGAALEFYTLRERIGEHAFDRALGEYVSSHRFGMASPSDLAAAFSDACGCRPDGALFTAAEN